MQRFLYKHKQAQPVINSLVCNGNAAHPTKVSNSDTKCETSEIRSSEFGCGHNNNISE